MLKRVAGHFVDLALDDLTFTERTRGMIINPETANQRE